jgi:hypothetical protein
MLSHNQRAKVLALHEAGLSSRVISRSLHHSRLTVRRIIRSGSPEPARPIRQRHPERYREEILKRLSIHEANLRHVHRHLQERGADFSYSTLTRFCRVEGLACNEGPTRSMEAAKCWLSEIILGTRSLDMVLDELKTCRDAN